MNYAANPEKTVDSDLKKAISYAGDEAKTESRCYVTGVNCNAETAFEEMNAVQERFVASPGDADSFRRNRQPVMIRLHCGVFIQRNAAGFPGPPQDPQPQSGGMQRFIPDHPGPEQRPGSSPFGKDHRRVPSELKRTLFFSDNMWKRQELHHIILILSRRRRSGL